METDLKKLLSGFSGAAPATADATAVVERLLKQPLPNDFKGLLHLTNGGEGFIGENYLMLWSAEEIAQYNQSYQVDKYAPGLLLFGSDGGGEGYGFDSRTTPPSVVMVPFVGMDLKHARPTAPNFTAFLQKLGG